MRRLGLPPGKEERTEKLGPVCDVSANTLWSMGQRESLMRPEILRDFVETTVPGSRSAVKLAQHLEATGRDNVASIVGVHVKDKPHVFNADAMGRWKSRARACRDIHPGMCACDAGLLLPSALEFAKQLFNYISKIRDESPGRTHFEQAGVAVFRLSSRSTPLSGPMAHSWVGMLSLYVGNPRRCAFVPMPAEDEDDSSIYGFAVAEGVGLQHMFAHDLALQCLRVHHGPWDVAEAIYTDISLLEVRVERYTPKALFLLCVCVTCVLGF